MRILLASELFWPYIGGIEVLSVKLARALRDRGHAVAVTASHGSLDLPDEDSFEGMPVRRFPFFEALDKKRMDLFEIAYRGLIDFRNEFRPDVIHHWFSGPAVLFHLRAQARRPIPSLLSFQNGWSGAHFNQHAVLKRSVLEFDRVVAVSKAVEEDIGRIAPSALRHTSVVHNALDMPDLKPTPLPFHPPRLLCLGRLVEEKGFDVAVRAFARLSSAYETLRLEIAGDGPARVALMHLSSKLGVADRVDFPGWVAPNRVPALMNRATIFVMPSRWREAFGLVTLQAMQMARPVVATAVGGSPELVDDGATGYLVPNEDDESMAARVAGLLAQPGQAAAMGQAGRERALSQFSFNRFVAQHEQLYSSIVNPC